MTKPLLLALTLTVLAGCSSHQYGRLCPGQVSTLTGQSLGQTQAWVFDEVKQFTVTANKVKVSSGILHSTDRQLYIPSAVTKEGFLAQRISADSFRIINPYSDAMITWTCPATAVAGKG